MSKLQRDIADDVTERMRNMQVCTINNLEEYGGVRYIAVKGKFRNDRFMHRIATDVRMHPGWVLRGPPEIYDEAVLNREDDVHYPPKGDCLLYTSDAADE